MIQILFELGILRSYKYADNDHFVKIELTNVVSTHSLKARSTQRCRSENGFWCKTLVIKLNWIQEMEFRNDSPRQPQFTQDVDILVRWEPYKKT